MSYVALVTDNFDEVVLFYGMSLGFPTVDEWDRENARGTRFDLGGMRLEILDNTRQREPLSIPSPGDRIHVVIEVDDIEAAHAGLAIAAPDPQNTSWGVKMFQVRDPDGVPVTFLQWLSSKDHKPHKLQGRVVTGLGRGREFTRLSWARRQFIELLQIDPYPGTLNLILETANAKSAWDHLKSTQGIRIINPDSGPRDCNARCYCVVIEGIGNAAIVLPEVADYPPLQIEIISEVNLRETFDISDGDVLSLKCCSPTTPVST